MIIWNNNAIGNFKSLKLETCCRMISLVSSQQLQLLLAFIREISYKQATFLRRAQKTTEQSRTTPNITGTHSDSCRNSPQNTSLKCRSLSTILSGSKLVALALAGRYLWAKSLKNKKLSLCLNLPTDRGLWRPPTELGTELWSQLKTLLYGTKWKRGRGESYKKQRNIEHCCYFFSLGSRLWVVCSLMINCTVTLFSVSYWYFCKYMWGLLCPVC